jgi:hypothetical protein
VFKEVIVPIGIAATDVVVTANRYGLQRHEQLDSRKTVQI